MSSPTSWMPFWLAATWARRSDRLSCRFRVPLQPGILPGACRASVTAAWTESPLSQPPSPGAAWCPALHLLHPSWALWAPCWPFTGSHSPADSPSALKTHSFLHLLRLLLPTPQPPTSPGGWGRQVGGGALSGHNCPSAKSPPSFASSCPASSPPGPTLFKLSLVPPPLSQGKKPLPLTLPHSHGPRPCSPHLPPSQSL